MKQYPKYKDSGIEWIGEIPEHWVVSKLKYSLDEIIGGGTPDTSNPSYWDDENGIPWVAISDITEQEILKKTSRKISVEGKESKGLEIIPRGTLLISIFASLGKTTLLDIDASANQAILGLIPAHKLIRDYLKYHLVDVERYISYYSSSNTQENLNLTKIKNLIVLLPPFPEQQTIANYLDRKTRQIDTLIENKQKQIDLLKEQRTAITNQAVTKGLNPNVKTKDSGIEWLGAIPEHWEEKKLKYTVRLINEKVENVDKYELLIALENIEGFTGKRVNCSGSFEGGGNTFKKGDVLFNKLRPYLCKVVLTPQEGVAVGELLVFRPNDFLNNRFLFYRILSTDFISIVNGSTYGAKMPRASWEFISNLKIPLPPIIEQQSITDYLDEKTTRIDKSIAKQERQIEHLKEYRTALISEVVTGKIDVRDSEKQEDMPS